MWQLSQNHVVDVSTIDAAMTTVKPVITTATRTSKRCVILIFRLPQRPTTPYPPLGRALWTAERWHVRQEKPT